MANLRRTWLDWRFLYLLPIPLLWALLAHYGFLDRLEHHLLDWRFQVRGEIEAPVKLIYVDVDTRALQTLGERPWNRAKFGAAAEVLLERGGARAVGFDFVFSALSQSELVDAAKAADGNAAFGGVIRRHPNIVLGVQYTEGQSVTQGDEAMRRLPLLRLGYTDRSKNDVPEMPQAPLLTPWYGRVGLIDFDKTFGGDEVPRWVPLFAHTMNPTLYHLSLQLVLQWLGLDEQAVKIGSDRIDLVRPDGRVALTIPLQEQQLVEVNWFSRWGNAELNPRVSLSDVLGQRAALNSPDAAIRGAAEEYFNWFRGAIVLIGPTDALLQDLAPTPLDPTPVPRVGVHGNLVKTMVSGKYLQRPGEWLMWTLVGVLTLSVCWLALIGGTRGVWLMLFALAIVGAYVGLCVLLFRDGHVVLPMAAPLGAALSTSFIGVGWQLIVEQRQKGRIKGLFGTYVSPQLVERMIESGEAPRLGGHDAEITAFFSDIQAFSRFSETLPPDKLVELMNEYLTACTDIVQEQGGTLDKYIGDAVVAMFGAPIALPDHAYRACMAAERVQLRLGELRAKWERESDKWPAIVSRMQTRIGLNSGLATIGNMGSRTRFNYTMMGDNVNLAARLESGAKVWGARSLVADTTRRQCEQHGEGRVVFRALGRVQVVGRNQMVPVSEIMGLRESVTPATFDCIEHFERGLARYLDRDWTAAAAEFEVSASLEPQQPDPSRTVTNPSLVYLALVAQHRISPPPANWDGCYVMNEK